MELPTGRSRQAIQCCSVDSDSIVKQIGWKACPGWQYWWEKVQRKVSGGDAKVGPLTLDTSQSKVQRQRESKVTGYLSRVRSCVTLQGGMPGKVVMDKSVILFWDLFPRCGCINGLYFTLRMFVRAYRRVFGDYSLKSNTICKTLCTIVEEMPLDFKWKINIL